MTFSYTRLSRSRRQIRLLEINNGISTGAPMYPSPAVVCTMKHFDFDACPRYRALSYAWGSQHPRTQVYIDGQPTSVSQGLGSFLERARHLDWLLTPGYIWIDQICIDQSNKDEKNNQVSFMGEIYQKATEVLVWLGPAAEGSSEALTAIRNLDFREVEKNQPGLRALFRRPYWTRLWVVQEILLSRSGKVLCGKSWLTWSAFTRFVETVLGKWKFAAPRVWPMSNSVLGIFLEREKSHEHRTLSGVIDKFGSFQCEHPHDKVFALQSLLPKSARIAVDYSMNLPTLWSTIVRRVAEDEGWTKVDPDRLLQFAMRLQNILEIDLSSDIVEAVVHGGDDS